MDVWQTLIVLGTGALALRGLADLMTAHRHQLLTRLRLEAEHAEREEKARLRKEALLADRKKRLLAKKA